MLPTAKTHGLNMADVWSLAQGFVVFLTVCVGRKSLLPLIKGIVASARPLKAHTCQTHKHKHIHIHISDTIFTHFWLNINENLFFLLCHFHK